MLKRVDIALPFGFLTLVIRGALLWLLIPLGILAWLLYRLFVWRPTVGLRPFLRWLDTNLVALIQATIFRPFLEARTPWLRWSDAPRRTHRIRIGDPL